MVTPYDIVERARLRELDAAALSRRYSDAVASMSEPADVAEMWGHRLSVSTGYGPLWEATCAASDDELPRVLRHFLDKRGGSPDGQVRLHVVPQSAPRQAGEGDSDDELQVLRRLVDVS